MPSVEIGKTFMGRDIFKEIFSAQRYSKQLPYHPSYCTCVDESMSRWYGIGGHWINASLPQYIVIDRNPENGCEI